LFLTCSIPLVTGFRIDFEIFGNPFWEPFWGQIGPRGAKMTTRGSSRTLKQRKPVFANTLKTHTFFNVFGGPRPSKTVYEDPRRLPRGYLG